MQKRLYYIAITLFIFTFGLQAQDNETCEMCHSEEDMTTILYGREVSLFVTSDHLVDTPHEDFDCIDCHTELDGFEDFPHPERLSLPDCGICHDSEQEEFNEGFYKPLSERGYTTIPSCQECHGKHKVSYVGKPKKVCGVCHQDVLRDFKASIHWDDNAEEQEISCVSCHEPHYKFEKSKYSPEGWKLKLVESCNQCHAEQVSNYHESRHFYEVTSGNLNAPVCSDCHSRHNVLSPRDPNSIVSVANLDKTCNRCHTGYERSIHRLKEKEDERLLTCVACHTGHNTDMKTKSLIFDTHISDVCLTCHQEILEKGFGSAHQSIHLEQLEKVKAGEVADCGSCHQYHYMAPDHLHDSAMRKECGSCHEKEQKEYENSSHYISRAKGHKEAPTCESCHSNRKINKMNEAYKGQRIIKICSKCHGDEYITNKFTLNPNVVEGYETSYHGQLYSLGYDGNKTATCVTCHNNHSILPKSNEQSSIHTKNIEQTCAQCHDDVNENFVGILQHYTPMEADTNKTLHIIDIFMKLLLAGTLSVFGLHTLLWFIRLLIHRIKNGHIEHSNPSGRYVKRFKLLDRIFHIIMVSGFLTLAFTGLPLKYSHTPLAQWLVHNIVGFRMAAILHRVAAITLGIMFVVHILNIFYKAFIKKEKGLFWGEKSLVPNLKDVKDFIHHILYFLGIKKTTPEFGRWTYWEKFDYLAVFWGMIVIGLSGLTLMFPELVTQMFPGWLINAAHIIHSEEALLATAFIFTVHFFNTHLRPGSFPLDDVIFSGRMPESKFIEERSLEKNMIDAEENIEDYYTEALPVWKSRLILIMGYFFLTIGLGLLALIIAGTFF